MVNSRLLASLGSSLGQGFAQPLQQKVKMDTILRRAKTLGDLQGSGGMSQGDIALQLAGVRPLSGQQIDPIKQAVAAMIRAGAGLPPETKPEVPPLGGPGPIPANGGGSPGSVQLIEVIDLATGEEGFIPPNEFNPSKYKRVGS